ncbi:hypothetical protein HDV00_009270 [Rhizophlyctis rosea]|nr:hypothetical protein HDV00_009270 [Rhizophlyctis rosea]
MTTDASQLPPLDGSFTDGAVNPATINEVPGVHEHPAGRSSKRRPLSALFLHRGEKVKEPKEKEKDRFLLRRLTSQIMLNKHAAGEESIKNEAGALSAEGTSSPGSAKDSKAEADRLKREEKERKKKEKKEAKEAKKLKRATVMGVPAARPSSAQIDAAQFAALATDLELQALAKRSLSSSIISASNGRRSTEQTLETIVSETTVDSSPISHETQTPSPARSSSPSRPSSSSSPDAPYTYDDDDRYSAPRQDDYEYQKYSENDNQYRAYDREEDRYPAYPDHGNIDDEAVERFLTNKSLATSTTSDAHDSLYTIRRRFSKSSFYSITPENITPVNEPASDDEDGPFELDAHFDPVSAAGPELNLDLWEVSKTPNNPVVQSTTPPSDDSPISDKRNPWLRNLAKERVSDEFDTRRASGSSYGPSDPSRLSYISRGTPSLRSQSLSDSGREVTSSPVPTVGSDGTHKGASSQPARPSSQISLPSTHSQTAVHGRSKLDELMGSIFSEIGNEQEDDPEPAEVLPAVAVEPTGTGAGRKALWAEKSKYFGASSRPVVRPPSPKPTKVNPETFDALVNRLERVMEKHGNGK